jgi:glycosidase
MITNISSKEFADTLQQAQEAAKRSATKTVEVDGEPLEISYPFPSPTDWRDNWIYFLMIDRFNNPEAPPNSTLANPPSAWNQRYGSRQGGTFKGVQQQLDYIQSLGAHAIWLSPVLKNSKPDEWEFNYHGYGIQDYLNVDERFGSDGTRETAERELIELVEEAHARGLYVILDIVLNHSARVFDYVFDDHPVTEFDDPEIMNAAFGQEPPIRWLNGFGFPRSDWQDNLPPPETLSSDDAVWPSDLQRKEFFRRRGNKLTDDPPEGGFVRGDFGIMRQLVVEYDARPPSQQELRDDYGKTPVLSILIRGYQYSIAKYDIDGFRVDTVKYVDPDAIQTFGNAIREFALSIGKRNFFTFGEIYDDEQTIADFIGRNGGNVEGFGVDAALDFPLFFKLPGVVKVREGVETIRKVFEARKAAEQNILSSHGEAGRFFISFLDNHDQKARFNHPNTPPEQVTMGLGLIFSLQGIPCLYYGTEQGLQGTADQNGNPDLESLESVREALWGKAPDAFDREHPLYGEIQSLAKLRAEQPPLRYGRLYFREASGNGQDFGQPWGQGGVLAFSRILADREVLVVANTHFNQPFSGFVLVDLDLNRMPRNMKVAYSNRGKTGTRMVQIIQQARFFDSGTVIGVGTTAALPVELDPMEIQILVPE